MKKGTRVWALTQSGILCRLTGHAQSPEAKLQAKEYDEAVGGIQFTGLLRVALKVPGALPQPQLPDLSYVDWRREREEGRIVLHEDKYVQP